MSEELKPCPFCGGEAFYAYENGDEVIECTCGTVLFSTTLDRPAPSQWNARADSPEAAKLRAENERLKEAMEWLPVSDPPKRAGGYYLTLDHDECQSIQEYAISPEHGLQWLNDDGDIQTPAYYRRLPLTVSELSSSTGKFFTCPVCGFAKLPLPPSDYHICICCGTEFENDDCGYSHEELRKAWIETGMQWWSVRSLMPLDFDPVKQLNKLLNEADPIKIPSSSEKDSNAKD